MERKVMETIKKQQLQFLRIQGLSLFRPRGTEMNGINWSLASKDKAQEEKDPVSQKTKILPIYRW